VALGVEREAVEQAIDRRQPLPAARLLLVDDAPKAVAQRALAQHAHRPLLVLIERVVDGLERQARPHVQIARRDIVAKRGEIDLAIFGAI